MAVGKEGGRGAFCSFLVKPGLGRQPGDKHFLVRLIEQPVHDLYLPLDDETSPGLVE